MTVPQEVKLTDQPQTSVLQGADVKSADQPEKSVLQGAEVKSADQPQKGVLQGAEVKSAGQPKQVETVQVTEVEPDDQPEALQAADVRVPVVAEGQMQMAAGTVQNVDAAASARTADIAETVEKIVATVCEQIEIVPSLVKGEETVIIRLKPEVLNGSEIRMSAQDGVLTLEIAPETPEAAVVVGKNIPQLERALAEHVTAFQGFSVVVKKGKFDETK